MNDTEYEKYRASGGVKPRKKNEHPLLHRHRNDDLDDKPHGGVLQEAAEENLALNTSRSRTAAGGIPRGARRSKGGDSGQ